MSSVNTKPTFHYSQPEAYRFSHDSVFLAQEVVERYRSSAPNDFRILDLCAGCGIVGLDFLFHWQREVGAPQPSLCDFLEVQEDYASHFQENARRLTALSQAAGYTLPELHFLQENYVDLLKGPGAGYDLIVSNPPYFRAGHGSLSPSRFKNRSRFFLDSDFSNLILAMQHALEPAGRAYFLLRDPATFSVEFTKPVPWQIVGEVRGTALAELQKPHQVV